MATANLYISHESALFYWRTNPSRYVLEGLDQNIRALRNCPISMEQVKEFDLFEAELGPDPIHLIVPPGAPRYGSQRFVFHTQGAMLPPHSLCPLHGGIHVVSPEVCLVQMCSIVPMTTALEIGMEFCGTYALRSFGIEEKGDRSYTLMSAARFRRHVNVWNGMHGLVQARKVATYLENGSASPMETKLYLLLCLPQKYGGYNLDRPELNGEVDTPEDAKLILRQNKIRPDLLWRNGHVVVEYDGEYHNDPQQAVRDELRRSILESMGYTVFVFKKQHIYNPLVFDKMALTVAAKLGKRVRPLTLKQQVAREMLRSELLGGRQSTSCRPD